MPTQPLALITGASSGLGAVFARQLTARGYRLVLVARRRDRLETLAGELGAEVLAADLTCEAGLAAVEERVRSAAELDLLVNNAGYGMVGRFYERDLENQVRMHQLHITATLRLSHAALAGMVARGRGALINVSSVAGFARSPGNVSYCASKAWIVAFTEGLDLELKAAGSLVKVQALCPGFTITEFHDVIGVDRAKIPARLWMQAADVVEASLRGLDAGKLIVVPGVFYKLLVKALPFVPYALMRAGAIRYSRRSGRV